MEKIGLGKAGRPRKSYDGPRKPDSILRKISRLKMRRYRARKRGDRQEARRVDLQLKEFYGQLSKFNHEVLGNKKESKKVRRAVVLVNKLERAY